MIRRNRHVALVLVGMLVVNFLTASVSLYCCLVFRSRFLVLSREAAASCKASEKASVEASASALLLADIVQGRSGDGDIPASPPRVVGYGQTRSRNALYIYRDVEQDGVVRREFVERIPFSALSPTTAHDPTSLKK